jgi:hypothetical protein
VACTTAIHTPEPYRSDPVAGAALSKRAADYCEETNPGQPQPTKRFLTDGCSRFPDTSWNVECCIEHDIAYWCGGTPEQRKAADAAFGECVAGNSFGAMGNSMELGVRVGGHPLWPTHYRWGYGHAYSPGYPEDSAP